MCDSSQIAASEAMAAHESLKQLHSSLLRLKSTPTPLANGQFMLYENTAELETIWRHYIVC